MGNFLQLIQKFLSHGSKRLKKIEKFKKFKKSFALSIPARITYIYRRSHRSRPVNPQRTP